MKREILISSGPRETRVAILEDDRLVPRLRPKEALGLQAFQHVHNAVCVRRNGRLYVIAQAWNPGDFAILEQVDQDP